MKKIDCLLLSLMLLLSVFPACAGQSLCRPYFDRLMTLLFDTDNVSLKGSASFSLDGEHFKTAEVLLVQDCENSIVDVLLRTPRKDGTILESGFTVAQQGYQAYVRERLMNVWTPRTVPTSTSIVRETLYTKTLLGLVPPLLERAEQPLPEGTIVPKENGLNIKLDNYEWPDDTQAFFMLLTEYVFHRFFGVSYDAFSGEYFGAGIDDYESPTSGILYCLRGITLSSADLQITVDEQQLLSGISGSISCRLTEANGRVHQLDIAFDATVSDYGATSYQSYAEKLKIPTICPIQVIILPPL